MWKESGILFSQVVCICIWGLFQILINPASPHCHLRLSQFLLFIFICNRLVSTAHIPVRCLLPDIKAGATLWNPMKFSFLSKFSSLKLISTTVHHVSKKVQLLFYLDFSFYNEREGFFTLCYILSVIRLQNVLYFLDSFLSFTLHI